MNRDGIRRTCDEVNNTVIVQISCYYAVNIVTKYGKRAKNIQIQDLKLWSQVISAGSRSVGDIFIVMFALALLFVTCLYSLTEGYCKPGKSVENFKSFHFFVTNGPL
jgi:hypothetical protein